MMTDHGCLPASVASYEQACLDAQVEATRVAGEASLSSFAARGDIVEVAMAVIQNSSLPVARFHACGALRVSVLERWEILSPALRHFPQVSIRDRVFTVACKRALEPFERTALLRAVATLSHRAYLEESKQSRLLFLREVCRLSSQMDETSSCSVSEALYSLELLAILVEEFAHVVTMSYLLTFDRAQRTQAFSEFCGADGELFVIHKAACAALNASISVGNKMGSKLHAFAKLAVGVLSAVLSFPASPCETMDEGSSEFVVHRGSEWGALLSDLPALVSRLFLIYNGLAGGESRDHASLVQSIRDALCSIAAVSKTSYARDPGTGNQTLLCLLRGLEERDWAFAQSRPELLMYAELWRRVSVAYGLESVFAIGGLEALRSFAKNTVSALRSKISSGSNDLSESSGDDEWTTECECLLLETWSTFAVQSESAGGHAGFDSMIAEVTMAFIATSLRTKLSVPGGGSTGHHLLVSNEDLAEDFGFDDESHEIALLQAAAQLCRYSGQGVIDFLASIITELSKRSFLSCRGNDEWSAGGLITLRAAQEDLVWTIRLSSAALADDESAEVPAIPAQYGLSGRTDQPMTTPMPLLTAVLQAAELESSAYDQRKKQGVDSCPELSPRVECTILEALNRLAKTYFVPMHSGVGHVEQCLRSENFGARARSLCLRKGLFTLKYRNFEPDSVVAAAGLLVVFAKARNSPLYPELGDNALWEPLPSAGFEIFESVPEAAVEMFGLCLSHLHREHVAHRLAEPVISALVNAGRNKEVNATKIALMSLQILCGISQCESAESSVGPILLSALRCPDGGVFIAAKEFTLSCPSVSVYCAKLAKYLTNMHLSSSSETSTQLFKDIVGLIRTSFTGWRKTTSDTIEEEEDRATLVTVYLDVLQQLVEFHGDDSTCHAAFIGMGMIMSVMSESIFTFPPVRPKFFLLVNSLVSKFPHHIIDLSADLSMGILSFVMAEIRGFEVGGTRRGLNAVAALADFRAQYRNPECQSAGLRILDNALEEYLNEILESILNGGGHVVDCLDAAADVLLQLTVCCERAFFIFEDACQTFVSRSFDRRDDAISILDGLFGRLRDYRNASRKAENDPPRSLTPGTLNSSCPRQLARVQFGESIRQLSVVARASFGQRLESHALY
jgi:hypothetical protein